MLNFNLPTNDDGTEFRTFKPISENNFVVNFETRDSDSRSLESAVALSSVHLTSNATRVLGKLQHVLTDTVETKTVAKGQNMAKIEIVISDDATDAERDDLANMFIGLAEQVKLNITQLDPIYMG
jgi:hypothetical protein